MPDSLTPRRLITVMKAMKASAISTRKGSMFGKADVIWATLDEIETATVRM